MESHNLQYWRPHHFSFLESYSILFWTHTNCRILLDYQRSDRESKDTCIYKKTVNISIATLGDRDAVRSLEALNPPAEFFLNAVKATGRSLVFTRKRKTSRLPLLKTETVRSREALHNVVSSTFIFFSFSDSIAYAGTATHQYCPKWRIFSDGGNVITHVQ